MSLDVMRGLTVMGMIIVNSAAIFNAGGQRAAYDLLLHVHWNGVTLADVVFPFFIFIMGVSIPFALSTVKNTRGLDGKLALRLFWRGGLLFLIGLLLTFYYFDMAGDRLFRIMGVLQRIGIAFTAGALIFMICDVRRLLLMIIGILLSYWLLMFAAFPDAVTTDLSVPGQNFVHWLDRWILGGHLYVTDGPFAFDPEGLLSSLPVIAQALIGVWAGQALKSERQTKTGYGKLLAMGFALTLAGWLWSFYLPMNKSLWSSSFVLYTSGLAMVMLVALIYLLDVKRWCLWFFKPAQDFGVNAITAYVLHSLTTGMILASPLGLGLYAQSLLFLPEKTAMLPVIFVVLLLTWLPLALLHWRGIFIKI